MLKNFKVFSSFSVDDLEKAEKFYSQSLGLEVEKTAEGLLLHLSPENNVFIYPKPNHAPATFTILNFQTDSIEPVVEELTKAGVKFEQYNVQYIKTDEKGISRNDSDRGPRAMAWFKDPAGNILSLMQVK